tara:strand:- start:457 stop:921 length:465 start_codon:yes stop_codon:yes gene_type:complete
VADVVASQNGGIMKIKRGQKLCKECGETSGARAKVCKHCGAPFEVRTDPAIRMKRLRSKAKRKGLVEVANWRELKPGQEVHYNGRSGSYWLNGDGTKDYTTDKGVYKIVNVLDKGFGAYGKKGYTFFDMSTGVSKVSPYLHNSPYKLLIKSAQS